MYAIWGGDTLKNVHKQPSSNSKVEKYNLVFGNWDQYAVSGVVVTLPIGFKTLEWTWKISKTL